MVALLLQEIQGQHFWRLTHDLDAKQPALLVGVEDRRVEALDTGANPRPVLLRSAEGRSPRTR